MATDKHNQADGPHPQAPWWWGIGPVSALALVLVGVALALWAFFGPSEAADHPMMGYQASKAIAIGLVVLGSALLERLRSRTSATDQTNDQDNGQGRRR
ncbi:hypothetical protein ACIHEJ_39150 [Streptomyces sp. NPDC052301]|uniref:hypothetical protein n=1 Tax=Streptomyces sp. NPDC052301 TaxID=3365687 RepID=UPI0037CFB8D0